MQRNSAQPVVRRAAAERLTTVDALLNELARSRLAKTSIAAEKKRMPSQHEAASSVQAAARGRSTRAEATQRKEAATRLQSVARGRAVRAAQAREERAFEAKDRAQKVRISASLFMNRL